LFPDFFNSPGDKQDGRELLYSSRPPNVRIGVSASGIALTVLVLLYFAGLIRMNALLTGDEDLDR